MLNPNEEAHLKTLIEIPFYMLGFKILFKNLWYDIGRTVCFKGSYLFFGIFANAI